MSTLPAWERLVAIATLGTGRGAAPLDELWPDASLNVSGKPEANVLRAAAATHLWNQAGRRAQPAPDAPGLRSIVQPNVEQLRETAAWRLGRLLNGEQAMLLEEWFGLAAATGRVLPPHWVPVALAHAPRELCLRFASVLGPMGQWLAQHNAQWTANVQPAEPALERWNAGTVRERCVQLRLMRSRDAAEGLNWLQGTWATDPPEAREAFLSVLQATVSAADEAFLEAALDDKRKAVRQAAAECLARVPTSAYLARAIARATPLLSWQPAKLTRKAKLEVHLRETPDKAAQRDGIETKPPASRKIGERAFWLMQQLSLVAPDFWSQRCGCSPTELLKAASATEYAQELLSAWSTAAVRQASREWLQALCEAWLASKQEPQLQIEAVVRLLAAAGEHRTSLRLAVLRGLLPDNFDMVHETLMLLATPWDAELTRLVMAGLHETVRKDKQQWSHARNTLQASAQYCHLATARALLPAIVQDCKESSPWRNALEYLHDVVEFRSSMQQELTQEPK